MLKYTPTICSLFLILKGEINGLVRKRHEATRKNRTENCRIEAVKYEEK